MGNKKSVTHALSSHFHSGVPISGANTSCTHEDGPMATSIDASNLSPSEPAERVGRGLMLGAVGALGGIGITVAIAAMGYVAAISGLALAFLTVILYSVGAGTAPSKGRIPLFVLIVLGLFLSYFAVLIYGVMKEFPEAPFFDMVKVVASVEGLKADPELLGQTMLFGLLGSVGVLRSLMKEEHAEEMEQAMASTQPTADPVDETVSSTSAQ